jgi:hypothetical protein
MEIGTMIVVGVAFGVLAAMAVGDHLFFIRKKSLIGARVGDVYNFEYLQPVTGKRVRHLAKILEVHRLSDEAVSRLNARSAYRRGDPDFHRGNHLVTAQMVTGETRNFYAERTRKAVRPPLGRLLFDLLD